MPLQLLPLLMSMLLSRTHLLTVNAGGELFLLTLLSTVNPYCPNSAYANRLIRWFLPLIPKLKMLQVRGAETEAEGREMIKG